MTGYVDGLIRSSAMTPGATRQWRRAVSARRRSRCDLPMSNDNPYSIYTLLTVRINVQ